MSDHSRRSSGSAASSNLSKRPVDALTRTALRYTLSPREYELLHSYLISRAPKRVQKKTPSPPQYETITKSRTESGDYNVAAVRDSLRIYLLLFSGLKGLDFVKDRLARLRGTRAASDVAASRYKHTRVALAFSTVLLFHRLLYRFFKRLRASLLEDSAKPFRDRNPGVTAALTSKFTPAVGASLAGCFLGLSATDQLRMTAAIYVLSRSLAFGYNALADKGYVWGRGEDRPWWFGSWLIMPFACGQLLHAFVFDRECFPTAFGAFILKRSPEYIQTRPHNLPLGSPWPSTVDIVDALAQLSRLRWPPFVSPILFPDAKTTLPSHAVIQKLVPITAPAHPGIKHASCAFLHPKDPSCARTNVKYWLAAFPPALKFFTLVYGAFALLGYKKMLQSPVPFFNRVSQRILRTSLFITGSIGTSWGAICLFNSVLPRGLLPTQRWFLGGFLGGLWAYIDKGERDTFLYSLRCSMDSLYKVGQKRGWWRGVRNGDVMVFMASLMLVNVVYELQPTAIDSGIVRRLISAMRGEGLVDVAAAPKSKPGAEKGEGKEASKKDI